ncbi:MAG: AAA family ATPase [Thermodesulfovibrionales bacterium]
MFGIIIMLVIIYVIFKMARGLAGPMAGGLKGLASGLMNKLSPVVLAYLIAVLILPGMFPHALVLTTVICGSLALFGTVLFSVSYLKVHDEKKLIAIRDGGGFMGNLIKNQEYWEKFQSMVSKAETMKKVDWDELLAYLKDNVVGQDNVIDSMVETTKFRWSRLKKSTPIGVYFEGGESGTGKTHLTKMLAKGIFGEGMNFLRIDCGELGEEMAAKIRLVGQTSGFVGDSGFLTTHLKNHPNSIVLFDEVEKAHPKVWDLMLPLFDEGRITDQRTNLAVDGTRAVFILTSNLEKEKLMVALNTVNEMLAPGGGPADTDRKQEELNTRVKEILSSAVDQSRNMKVFRPELLNRLDAFFVFDALKPVDMGKISALEIVGYLKSADGIEVDDIWDINQELLYSIVQRNMQLGETGAREIRKIVEKLIRRASQLARLDGVTKVRVDVEEGDHLVLIPTEVKPDVPNGPEVLQKRYL